MEDGKEINIRKLRAYKQHKFIVFELENGTDVKYDLSTGKTYGKSGKEVKNLNGQLMGHNVYDVIESFEDPKYKKFLRYILKHKINCSLSDKRREVDKVRNVGTFLSRIKDHSKFEQYFAAEIDNIEPDIEYTLDQIPKQLIAICKEHNLELTNELVNQFKERPALFINVLSCECDNLSVQDKLQMLTVRWHCRNFFKLTDSRENQGYNYNIISLIKYIDQLMTYEALTYSEVISELSDYCDMMNKLSPKFEKYPKHFLTTVRIATRNYNRLKQQFDEVKFVDKIDISFEWTDGEYIVIYPKSTQAMKDEAVQQSNCVASYIDKVINDQCKVVFLRDKKDKDKSLITMEVIKYTEANSEKYRVKQAKGKSNREITPFEQTVVDKYEKYLNRKQAKVDNKAECEIKC